MTTAIGFLDDQIAKDQQAQGQWSTPGQWLSGQSGSTTGGTGNVGGDWSSVEQWSATIQQAAKKYGVPVNLIKSVMMRESGGQNLAINDSSAVGPMQVTTNNWSGLGYNLYDPSENIMAGAAVLRQMYDTMGSWEGAVRAYLAGPGGAYQNVTDSFGTNPDSYWADVNANWQKLNGATGGAGLGFGGGSSMGWDTVFGGVGVPEWGEFGVESTNGLYDYGKEYGLNGTQHTGVDVPLPIGTPYRAPMSGTITCAGTGNGSGAEGMGCAAFGDPIGGGVGRVELLLDNGAVLIFGHSNQSMFQPGQRVTAGQVIGTSGGMVSPHIHLEARVRDPQTGNWRIVDPRTVIGGGSFAGGGYTGGAQSGGSMYGGYGNPISWFLADPNAKW